MNRFSILSRLAIALFVFGGFILLGQSNSRAEDPAGASQAMDPETQELMNAADALAYPEDTTAYRPPKISRAKSKAVKKNYTRAEAFLAGPDWEFDGFVAGGQDAAVKSMFVLNDLIYLNVGAEQNIERGDTISIYRRGPKVRDPQTGRFIGFEVRRAAITQVTNKVDDETCAARIMKTFEGVEIGDLVRRGQ